VLLADEPTSDLDEDSEADIIGLLEALRRSEGFAFVLVTHNHKLAGHTQRTYEMRQGILAPAALAKVDVAAPRHPRHFGPAEIQARPDSAPRPRRPIPPRGRIPLGASLLRTLTTLLLATFRRKFRFSVLRSIAPRKAKPAGGDRRLENRLTVR
jgi:ABC-type glutathione transport system ATPase component